jgi:hypothetical protein
VKKPVSKFAFQVHNLRRYAAANQREIFERPPKGVRKAGAVHVREFKFS